ncbi:Tad domain-containing protein [Streptomyces sp. NPDC021354]|uniref:TadE/TadG family type IV pilus assembly protein n=1 Tax=Streptomyces sp. NPDC021354 TaxID=3154793 RepID=UPI0033DF8B73
MIRTLIRRRIQHSSRPADAGSMTLFYAVMALMGFLVIGLVVDGGGAMNAQSRADYAAQEAARAGGQQIDPAQAIPGTAIAVDPDAARAAARAYLEDKGLDGTVTVSQDGQTLTVTVSDTYNTFFTSLIGYSTINVTGHGTAHLLHQAGG